MKTSAQHSDGSGLVFRGPFVYGRSTSGTLTFGSAAIAGGRITSAGVQYNVTDHLGSDVAVVKGSDGLFCLLITTRGTCGTTSQNYKSAYDKSLKMRVYEYVDEWPTYNVMSFGIQ